MKKINTETQQKHPVSFSQFIDNQFQQHPVFAFFFKNGVSKGKRRSGFIILTGKPQLPSAENHRQKCHIGRKIKLYNIIMLRRINLLQSLPQLKTAGNYQKLFIGRNALFPL